MICVIISGRGAVKDLKAIETHENKKIVTNMLVSVQKQRWPQK